MKEGESSAKIWAILSIVFAFLFFPLGILFGIIAQIKIKNNSSKSDRILTTASLVINVVVFILLIILGFIIMKKSF